LVARGGEDALQCRRASSRRAACPAPETAVLRGEEGRKERGRGGKETKNARKGWGGENTHKRQEQKKHPKAGKNKPKKKKISVQGDKNPKKNKPGGTKYKKTREGRKTKTTRKKKKKTKKKEKKQNHPPPQQTTKKHPSPPPQTYHPHTPPTKPPTPTPPPHNPPPPPPHCGRLRGAGVTARVLDQDGAPCPAPAGGRTGSRGRMLSARGLPVPLTIGPGRLPVSRAHAERGRAMAAGDDGGEMPRTGDHWWDGT